MSLFGDGQEKQKDAERKQAETKAEKAIITREEDRDKVFSTKDPVEEPILENDETKNEETTNLKAAILAIKKKAMDDWQAMDDCSAFNYSAFLMYILIGSGLDYEGVPTSVTPVGEETKNRTAKYSNTSHGVELFTEDSSILPIADDSNPNLSMRASTSLDHSVPTETFDSFPNDITDRAEAINTVQRNGKRLRHVSEKLKRDKEVVLRAVSNDGSALQYAPRELREDPDIVLKALRSNKHGLPGHAMQYASNRLRGSKEFVCAAVMKDGNSLKHVAKNLKNDRDVVSFAVLENGKALQFASADLQNDREIVSVAVVSNPDHAMQYASDRLRGSKEFVISVVSKDGTSLGHVAEHLKNDKDVVLAAVKKTGKAIKYSSQRLQHDKDVVLAALRQDGNLLESVPEGLRADRDCVLAAISSKPGALRFASQRLQHDKDVVLAALRQNGNLLESVPESLRADRDCVLAAISSKPGALRFALGGLNQDRECLIGAGLWDKEHGTHRPKMKIVLSTRFSLAAESSPTATEFTNLLKKHPYFRNSFQVYSPNAFNKQTCDPNWTDMEWKCRGTKETCQMKDRSLCEGPPRSECCWRYSYRCHLAEAKASHGFMIQVVEKDRTAGPRRHEMGKGQAIERVMAEQVGTKVFAVHERLYYGFSARTSPFGTKGIDQLAEHVKKWYANGCEDISREDIHVIDWTLKNLPRK